MEQEKSEKYEICVVCGKVTDVLCDTPIDRRPTYVEGAGQLCRECCMKLYHSEDLRVRE